MQVFGTKIDAPLPIADRSQPAASGLVVFSTNYNEDNIFLIAYIDNFLNYTPDNCHLFLNFPRDRSIPAEALNTSKRVHIFNGVTERKKWGGTLLIGHMESFGKARDILGSIDYFCTCASNGLFVRKFDFIEAVRSLDLGHEAPTGMTREYYIDADLTTLPREGHGLWIWNNLRNSQPMLDHLKEQENIERFSLAQIEGLFAEAREWETLYTRLDFLHECNNKLGEPHSHTPALEEFFPVTFFRHFGKGRFTNICYMLWDPIREVTLEDLANLVEKMPEQMCQIKWFARNFDTMPTAAITQAWSRAFLETLTEPASPSVAHDRFRNRLVAQELVRSLRQQETYTPLTRLWREDARWGRIQWLMTTHLKRGEAVRLVQPLSNLDARQFPPQAWFMTPGDPDEDLFYEAILAENGNTATLTLNSSIGDDALGRQEYSPVQGILFLSPLIGDGAQVFRLSLKRPTPYAEEQILHNIRRSDGTTDQAWAPILHEDDAEFRHFYFLRPQNHKGEIWIGIPNFARTAITLEMAVGTKPF